MTNFDPDQLAALAAVVAEGTFDAAARSLHVTPSAVSQRIKALETAAGRVVVSRAKPVRPTDAGAVLMRLARQTQTLTADTLRELGGDDAGAAVVPIAVNSDSLATWLPDVFQVVSDAQDRPVTFDIRRADQDRTTDLLRDGTVMAAITSDRVAVPGCAVTRLGRMVYRAAAAPRFLDRWFAEGPTLDALAAAPVVVYDRTDRLQDTYLRRRTRRRIAPPRHHVPDSWSFVRAVEAGLGWGMIPDQQRHRASVVDIDHRGAVAVTLYWQQWRLRSAILDSVAERVQEVARRALS